MARMKATTRAKNRSADSLKAYRGKRDFKHSPEPPGQATPKRAGRKASIFVIQKHDATTLHYDFRLEAGGVLKSWAVPKGPSTNPRDKRLAMPTEDHPLDYGDFEGVIPEGHYGAGSVIVWDTGPYENIKRDDDGEIVPMEKCLEQGRVEVELKGRKLKGGYALIRMGDGKRWLLIKMRDKHADARRNPVSAQPQSVLSGRTIDEMSRKANKKKGGA